MKKTTSSFLGFDKIAELLIQKGADVNVLGQFGRTALSWAATKGKIWIFMEILFSSTFIT